jgi:tRNA pseudouridine55 synthase
MKHNPAGCILLNKPPGRTSFEALRDVKRVFAPAKVGHTGTLDKFADGLLLVLVGRAVKLASWFSQSDKKYEGTISFGIETDTLDPEGVPVATAPPPDPARLEAALSAFRGEIIQTPPAYSAIHVKGRRASALARQGKHVEMPGRTVRVYALELRSYDPPVAVVSVHCSKGTYIRSLARDIALAAGSRAHLASLTRTAVGRFLLSEASVPPDLTLLPLDTDTFARIGLPCRTVSEETALRIRRGQALREQDRLFLDTGAETVAVFSEDGTVLAIAEAAPPLSCLRSLRLF